MGMIPALIGAGNVRKGSQGYSIICDFCSQGAHPLNIMGKKKKKQPVKLRTVL